MSLSLASPPQPSSLARPPSRTRRALWLLAPLFPGRTDPGYGAAHGGATYREPRHDLYVVTALLEGGKGTFFEVLLQELHGFVVQLRSRSGPLLRSQRFSAVGLVYVRSEERRV